jgi:hypothetical protein
MDKSQMNEIGLFGGSFVFVFALSYQQQNIHYRRYLPALVNAAFIAGINLFVIRLGSQATAFEMIAFIAGQPFGTFAAMWLDSRRQNPE